MNVLATTHPDEKAKQASRVAVEWKERRGASSPSSANAEQVHSLQQKLLIEPPAPDHLRFANSSELGSPRSNGVSLGVWLLHSLAHVEYNAINLAFDMIVRWSHCYEDLPGSAHVDPERNEVTLPLAFYEDWLSVGADEARHHWCLQRRLEELDSFYGALPVHNTLWQCARDSATDLTGRLVVIPLVQEARGLDAHPRMVDRILGTGDKRSAQLVDLICSEETDHVKKGIRWFSFVCKALQLDTEQHFAKAVRQYVPGGELLPPFNVWAR